mgnify:CR=1 FL=1
MVLKEIGYCTEAISKMQKASSLDEYEKYWIDFLKNFQSIINKSKFKSETDASVSTACNQIRNLQKNNDLYKYLFHARNCNEHTTFEINEKVGSHTTVTGGKGGGRILRGEVRGDGKANTLVTEGNIQIEFHPERIGLLPAKDRGKEYAIPLHRPDGKILNTNVPDEIAEIALLHLSSIINH